MQICLGAQPPEVGRAGGAPRLNTGASPARASIQTPRGQGGILFFYFPTQLSRHS